MDVQLSEPAPEILVLFNFQRLVAEEDHGVLHQRVMDFLELLIAERLVQIDPGYLGADPRRKWFHVNRFIRHGGVPSRQCPFSTTMMRG